MPGDLLSIPMAEGVTANEAGMVAGLWPWREENQVCVFVWVCVGVNICACL